MKKITVFIFVCALGSLSVNAQFKPDFTAGIDYTSINLKRGYPTDQDLYGTLGYHFGFELKLPLKENLNISTGLLLSKKGFTQKFIHPFRSPIAEYDSVTKFNVSYYYLELPILMEFKAKFDKMNVLFGVGPYVSYGIAGNVNLQINSLSTDYSYSEKIRWKPYFDQPTETGSQLIVNGK